MSADFVNRWISVLLDSQAIDGLQAEAALQKMQSDDTPVWRAVESVGGPNRQTQLDVLAKVMGTEVVEIRSDTFPRDLLKLVRADEVLHHRILPYKQEGRDLYIVVVDPFDMQVFDSLEYRLRCSVKPVLADPEDVQRLINQLYAEAIGESEPPAEPESEDPKPAVEDVRTTEDSPIVQVVDKILRQAIREKASDIHFEPFEDTFKIRYRVDGALHKVKALPLDLASSVISRVKVLGDLDIAEKRKPQDGRIRLTIDGHPVDMRISCLPTQYGESVVLRVLDQNAIRPNLQELGLRPRDLNLLNASIAKPNGILLVTGPTGSGKTTTLYACLLALNNDEVKILTAEDPVEYEVRGLMQVPIHEDIGMTFARALRTFLRQDPDIIMIGEMRDLETAQIAIQSSLTGHLVLSTLHTNSAPASVSRLIDMGVEPFLLASSLSCVLAQRLIRTCCPSCRGAVIPEEKQLRRLGLPLQGQTYYAGKGCPSCNQLGYRGRKGIYEVMDINEPIRQLITERAPTLAIREKAIQQGMTTLREDGVRHILAGNTTVEEVLRYT